MYIIPPLVLVSHVIFHVNVDLLSSRAGILLIIRSIMFAPLVPVCNDIALQNRLQRTYMITVVFWGGVADFRLETPWRRPTSNDSQQNLGLGQNPHAGVPSVVSVPTVSLVIPTNSNCDFTRKSTTNWEQRLNAFHRGQYQCINRYLVHIQRHTFCGGITFTEKKLFIYCDVYIY